MAGGADPRLARREVTESGDAVYHAGAIGHLAELSDQDDAWRTWFAANGIEPLTIAYEELAADTHEATAARARPPRRRAGRDPRAAAAPPGRRPLRALGRAVPHAASPLDHL